MKNKKISYVLAATLMLNLSFAATKAPKLLSNNSKVENRYSSDSSIELSARNNPTQNLCTTADGRGNL